MSCIQILLFTAIISNGRLATGRVDDPSTPPAHPSTVRVVAFSPDGQTLVAGFGGKDQPSGAAAWEVATGKRLWHLPGNAVTSVSFAPDGKAVAITRGENSALRLDPLSGKTLGEVGPHPTTV